MGSLPCVLRLSCHRLISFDRLGVGLSGFNLEPFGTLFSLDSVDRHLRGDLLYVPLLTLSAVHIWL